MANIKQVQVGTITYDIHAVQADNSAKLEGKTLQQVVDQAKSEGSFAHFVLATNAATTPKGVVWTKSGTSITGTLEAASADKNVLYLVPSINSSAASDVHDEYIVVQSGTTYAWERVGHTDIKLKAVSKNTGGPSNNNTDNAGAATVTTSEFDHGSATGSVSLVYKKSGTATGSAGSTATADTGNAGGHSHTFTGTKATISISSSGSAAEAGEHNHTVTPSTTSVIATVSGTTTSINAAPAATGSASGHTHSISPSTTTIYSAPSATGETGAHTHTVTVDSHSHGTNVTVLNGVSASTTSIYQITGVGSKASGSDVSCATVTVDVENSKLIINPVTATKISSYGSVATRQAVTVATDVSSTTASVAAPGSAATLTASCSSTGAHTHSIGRTSQTVVTGITVTGSAGAHTHGITGVAKTVVTGVTSTAADVLTGVSLADAGAHTHSVSASGSAAYTPAGTLNSTGSHSHTYVSLPAHTHGITLTDTTISDDFSIAIGKHTHSVTIANHSHTLNSHTHSYNTVENDQA